MLSLGLKMLLRKRGNFSIYLGDGPLGRDLGLDDLHSQLRQLLRPGAREARGPGRTYLIISEGATSITDSRLSAELARELRVLGYFDYVIPQRGVLVNATTRLGSGV